ncbi:sulfotransferase family protein [Sphingobium ummariense]|uniref:sulfotransferase family 2 domain-containing protein n=1 Tax=Sphingobium ummariense TaxID=420994 RepID=UPI00137818A9|nr:sulfotransferase family 2 domain-containing protein [Sphingobium ummariense]
MTNAYPNIELFHVHIPKTAGSSLNHTFEKAYGAAFCRHDPDRLKRDTGVRLAASHTTLASALPKFPNARFITVLREPESRFKSAFRHLFARRKWPDYASIGPIIERLVDADGYFVADEDLIFGDEFRDRFDNLEVRYLSPSPIRGRVSYEDRQNTIAGLNRFYRILFQGNFNQDVTSLFADLGQAGVPPEDRNHAKSKIPLWDKLPPVLEAYLEHDHAVYAAALERPQPEKA